MLVLVPRRRVPANQYSPSRQCSPDAVFPFIGFELSEFFSVAADLIAKLVRYSRRTVVGGLVIQIQKWIRSPAAIDLPFAGHHRFRHLGCELQCVRLKSGLLCSAKRRQLHASRTNDAKCQNDYRNKDFNQ